MSIYDKASLIQIPSGYKAGELYSVIPNSGAGDFTHTRSGAAKRVNSQGLIETVNANVPRLDYPFIDGVVQDCPHLLLEPTRRNLFFNSEDFTNASWNKTRTTITGNQATAPDGSNNADLLTGDGTGTSYVFDGVFLYSATYYVSIFVKNINGNDFTIQNFSQAGTGVFDLTNGTVTSTSGTLSDAKIEQYPNNWYRISVKITSTLGGANANIGYGVKDYNGDQFYIWGAQIEDNASGGSVDYLTSYIQTGASAVTRTLDDFESNFTGLTSTAGTIFLDFTTKALDFNFARLFAVKDSVTNEGLYLGIYSTNTIAFFNINSGSGLPAVKDNISFNERVKIALTFDGNGNYKYSFNGSIQTGTYSGTTRQYDKIGRGNVIGGGSNNISIYQLMMFNEVLSDSELQTLTSYSSFNSMATALGYKII